ncbi:hypothetical protein [Sphingobacterium wenxiniae]|uniref:Uncharacterized protein n=1 Tax=Sphingobacterium wenxiniae TaxID=683125 RepID=A0A1I6NTI7_9SPHI|nr:hypothetical protein [Sphingobacterium wenxiniae]SFS31185.1 hypothetical protein SAMN05660206_10185 [Sphingobacterium wenxiniae]
MSTPSSFSQFLVEQFYGYSTDELINLNNDIVENNVWGSSRSAFRNAVLKALSKRGIDLSPIISKEDGFSIIHIVKVRLENNVLIPVH